MGNFSRDTFDPQKHYASVRLQQGVPLVDADWNEMEDIRRHELRDALRVIAGSGVVLGADGFRVSAIGTSVGKPNDFAIGAGTCLVDGWTATNPLVVAYSAQPLFQDAALAAAWGVAALPALTTPAAARTDTVYLDVWEREVGEAEDPELVNGLIGIETSVRIRREWAVRVAEGAAATPAAPAGHAHFELARLVRGAGQAAISAAAITDRRATVRDLAFQSAEVARLESAKVNRAGDTVAGSLVVGGSLGVGPGTSPPAAPLHLAGGALALGTGQGDLRIGDATHHLKVGVGLAAAGAEAGHVRLWASERLNLGRAGVDMLALTRRGIQVGSLTPEPAEVTEKFGIWSGVSGGTEAKYALRGDAGGDQGQKMGLFGRANGATTATTSNHGVYGEVHANVGTYTEGKSYAGYFNAIGSFGHKYGVYAQAINTCKTNYGIYAVAREAVTNYAGYFEGNVHVAGTLSKTSGTFLIDHPLDPENRVLRHNFVESPEPLCLYRGKVRLGEDGSAPVPMPDYFRALTSEEGATALLTPLGARPFAVSYEWNDAHDTLVVYGDPGAEVSYLVVADRDDPSIRVLRQPVEEDKGEAGSAFPRGEYLFPDAYPDRPRPPAGDAAGSTEP
jgi:hypothetical protein